MSIRTPASTAATRQPPVLPNLLRSEWAKIRTVRSTRWSLLVAAAAMIGLGAIITATQPGAHAAYADPVSASLAGVLLAQLAIGALGVLVITSEYSTGMIRATFAAAPQRRMVIAAKACVSGAAAFTVGTVAGFVAFFVGQAILGHHGVSLSAPGALRSVLGLGLYLGLLDAFAVGLCTMIRSSAGAIATLFGLIFALPIAVAALPTSIRDSAGKYLPSNAGQAIFNATSNTHELAPWVGLAVFATYAAAALAISLFLVRRRDA